ncbi:SAM-dependent methyltransferase [Campylobacterota bacterium]|nr:SAM-dependent methyltransferase [Campylobacterota bacterium]
MNSLDLYARFEPLIPFTKEIGSLHGEFIACLKRLGAKNALDVGCGSGAFLERLGSANIAAKGIDKSEAMIKLAASHGVAECVDLADEKGFYDAVTAVFDVVNYLKSNELVGFFCAAFDRLNDRGSFLFDVNTLHGFEAVAQGDLALEKSAVFGTVRSKYIDERLVSIFDLFTPNGDQYKRDHWEITQYFHTSRSLQEALKKAGFSTIKQLQFHLYSGEKADKTIYIASR